MAVEVTVVADVAAARKRPRAGGEGCAGGRGENLK